MLIISIREKSFDTLFKSTRYFSSFCVSFEKSFILPLNWFYVDRRGDIRNSILNTLESDIVGPRGGKEESLPFWENPTQSYVAGILFPKETPFSRDDDEQNYTVMEGDDDEFFEDPLNINAGIKPSSFGLTFTVDGKIPEIIVDIEYGTYAFNETKEEDSDKIKKSYIRTNHNESFPISLSDTKGTFSFSHNKDFKIKYSIKKFQNNYIISVFVINDYDHKSQEMVPTELCLFQPKITVYEKNNSKIFLDSSSEFQIYENDLDEKLFDLLFRDKKNFAIGHGCSVDWNNQEIENDRVSKLSTTFIPHTTIPKIEPMSSTMDCLSMETLFKVKDASEYRALLQPLADTYEQWIISELENKLPSLNSIHHDAAKNQISECRNALNRIKEGIEIICTDKIASESFSFANRAMMLQRTYGLWAQKNRDSGKIEGVEPENFVGTWRPFQLAFFLLNIKSITRPDSDERNIAELLWFPTGGGKTEAYLGIIAFTMVHRRLRTENPKFRKYGTVVLMRYTLRLLTIQQFQRAATLMCACEVIRRIDEKKWGDEPFSVGLWVGRNTTPNILEGEASAEETLEKAKQGIKPKEHNPIQLISCPWCGAKLYDENNPFLLKTTYKISGQPKQLRIFCSNTHCAFYDKGKNDQNIPVLVVDDDIYSRCPSLIIGTVDKFAQIAWKWETGAIFGKVDKQCEKHGFVKDGITENCGNHKNFKSKLFADFGYDSLEPPELIIQDELHLISGPLGTLTGLYETAIDVLCTNEKGIRPKIIASTATTRKTSEQILGLFNREQSNVFPPQGFNFGDSFFASQVSLDIDPGKIYAGVCATARSGLTVLGRISAAILQKIRSMKINQETNGYSDKELDSFYTLVAYFNSIRELGGSNKMYEDTVPGQIGRIYKNFDKDTKAEYFNSVKEELTSRVDSGKIPKILEDLSIQLGEEKKPIDILLSTNMLSVGVDIPRLGVMIINGHPKNHSEYIQATGRIGRNSPGLIVTSYNYLKPRDLSHYENFGYYHNTFHKNVEPASLTPFAPRSRDKALFGIIVALVRLLDKNMAKNTQAATFDKTKLDIEKLLNKIHDELEKRVDSVDSGELASTMSDFDNLIKKWHESAKMYRRLKYKRNPYKKEENDYFLLGSIESPYDGIIQIPNSLRDAEQNSLLRYVTSLGEEFD